MSTEANLKSEGWYLSPDGIAEITENDKNISVKEIVKKALDIDLKNIGSGVIPDDVNKGKKLPDLCVLQVVRITNVSAPKINEESNHAPRLLKIVLTDGLATCTALELLQLKTIDVHTPPGTKVRLKGSLVSCKQGYLFLTSSNVEVLGGKVQALIDKWKLKESLVNYKRSKLVQDGGPPPWVPFGKKITGDVQDLTGKFKSLDTTAAKEAKENDAFELQRKATIAEIAKAKAAGSKTFGGGKQTSEKESYPSDRYSKPKFGGASSSSSTTGGATDKPTSFTRGDSGASGRGERGDFHSTRGGRPERSGRGRGRRDDGDEDGAFVAPSRPSTLFDFLQSKIESIEGKNPSDSADTQDHQSKSFDSPRDAHKTHSAPYENRRQPFGNSGREDWKSKSNDHHDNTSRHRDSRGGGFSSNSSSYRGGGRGARSNDYNNRDSHSSGSGYDRRSGGNSSSSYGGAKSQSGFATGANATPVASSNRTSNRFNTTSDNNNSYLNSHPSSDRQRSGNLVVFGDDQRTTPGSASNRARESTNHSAGKPAVPSHQANRNQVSESSTSHSTFTPKLRTAADDRPHVASSSTNHVNDAASKSPSSHTNNANTAKFSTIKIESHSTRQNQQTSSRPNHGRSHVDSAARPTRVERHDNDDDAFEKLTCPPMPDFGLDHQHRQPQQHNNGHHLPHAYTDFSRPPPIISSANNRTGTGGSGGATNHFAGADASHHATRNSHQAAPYLMQQQQQQPPPLHVNVNANYQPSLSNYKGGGNSNALLSVRHTGGDVMETPGVTRAWQGGDVCMAKYWEDGKHYPAVVHAVGPTGTTCVVLFTKYGNYEEVFVDDMKPWKRKEEQGNYQMNSGTVEFRRGGTRPYVVRHNFSHQLDQDQYRQQTPGRPTQQVYVPPAQRQ